MKARHPQWPTLLLLEKKMEGFKLPGLGVSSVNHLWSDRQPRDHWRGAVPLLLQKLDVAFSEPGAIFGLFSSVSVRVQVKD